MKFTLKMPALVIITLICRLAGSITALAAEPSMARVEMPTVNENLTKITRGDSLIFSGRGTPLSNILLTITSDDGQNEYFIKSKTRSDGLYEDGLDTAILEPSKYFVQAKSSIGDIISESSGIIEFTVYSSRRAYMGVNNDCVSRGDLNNDCRVNLTDVSILAKWFNQKKFDNKKIDLNNDGIINISDLSIMLQNWTE